MNKLIRKPVTIAILFLIAVTLLLVLAVPALAAGPFAGDGGTANTGFPGVPGTTVRGTVSGSIIVTPPAPGAAVTLSMPTGNVTAVYSVSGTTKTLEQLMVNIPWPMPGKPGTPPVQKGTMIQGTVSGSIIITPPAPGAAVTLSMPTGNVTAVYSVSGTTKTLEQLMINMPRPAPGKPGTPPVQKGTTVRGTVNGSIIVTPPAPGAAVTLSMPTGNVTAVYSVSGTTKTLEQLMINMPRPAPGKPGTPPVQKGTMIQGTLSGSIIITPPAPGAAVTLSMPTGNVTAVYSVSGTTKTLEQLMVNMPRPAPGTPGFPDRAKTP